MSEASLSTNPQSSAKKAAIISVAVAIGVLLIDQISKIVVKTNMELSEHLWIFGEWAEITFHENPGMAFSMKFGEGDFAKVALTLFRIVAAGFLVYYLTRLIKKGARLGFVVCISLILAGAVGNIIDSVFYGVIFSQSGYWSGLPNDGNIAHAFQGDGYAGFLHGKVVDMLHFPMFDIPLPGGGSYTFFDPVFNVADSSIFIGIAAILLFFRKELLKEEPNEGEEPEDGNTTEPNADRKAVPEPKKKTGTA